MSEVYYFGAWGGPGHFLWTPDGHAACRVQRKIPWLELDVVLAGDPALETPRRRGHWREEHQPEGKARLHRRDGWTALAFWDRSCDTRYGSNSAIIARGEHDAAAMLELFRRHFPAVWERIAARFQVSV